MTIEALCHALNIPVETGLKWAQDNGIRCGAADPLSEAQMETMRIVVLRMYRPGTRQAPPKPAKPVKSVPHEPAPAAPEKPVIREAASAAPKKQPVRVSVGPVDPIMEQLVLEKKIMIDTCSLMHDKCGSVIRKLLPALEKHGKKLLVPQKVIGELEKHSRCHTDPGKVASANQALKLVQLVRERGCLDVRGAGRDNFADNTFYVALSQYRTEYHMLLITQDRGLSRDVLKLNEVRSVKGHPIEVMYINGMGSLNPSDPW